MAAVALQAVTKIYPDGTKAVDGLDLSISDGEFMVLVGPSGCGKTTALRMVAGLEEISAGSISIGSRVVNDLDCGERDIAMVFQNYALYPHMTVAQNLNFPLRLSGMRRPERDARIRRTARMLGIESYLGRRPARLSGGQRQRVAMGRALVREPQVFLMDEPLSNLDAKLRVQMRGEIAGLQRSLGITTIYVTHDQVEALTMGDRIAVMRGGLLQQVADPETLYNAPANLFVAAFIGAPAMNLLEGELAVTGQPTVRVADQQLTLDRAEMPRADTAGPVVLGIRPEDLRLAHSSQGARKVTGTVRRRESVGSDLLVTIGIEGAPPLSSEVGALAHVIEDRVEEDLPAEESAVLTARLAPGLPCRVNDRISLELAPGALRLFDRRTGLALGEPRLSGRAA